MAENYMVMYLALSIMVNVFVVFILVFTKIGREAFQRFRRKMMFKKGTYVNTFMCLKSGVIKEVFKKKGADGSFSYNHKKYITTPQFRMPYNDIPTYVHVEDESAPVDIFDKGKAGLLSANEMDIVMMAGNNLDIIGLVKQWMPVVFMVVGLIIVGLALSAYFGASSHSMLRDGSAKVICAVVNNAAGVITPMG